MASESTQTANISGRQALAGFLNQSFGIGGLAVLIHSAAPSDQDLGVLYSLISEGTLTQERLGQDALIEKQGTTVADQTRRRIFVQFKHSSEPANFPLRPNELLDVVASLRNSEAAANQIEDLPSEFVLITNRDLSQESRDELTAAVNETQSTHLGAPTQKRAEREILKRLTFVRCTGAKWHDHIAAFARRYGVLDDELELGLERMIGNLSQSIGASVNKTLDERWLCQMLSGVRELQVLSPPNQRMRDDLAQFEQGPTDPRQFCRREALDELSNSLFRVPIVVLIGPGGCGKTVLIQIALHELLQQPEGAFAALIPAERISSNPLSDLTRQLRGGDPNLAVDSEQKALRRLEIACIASGIPLLTYGLDGVDETTMLSPDYKRRISDLLDFAYDQFRTNPTTPPQLVVMISCRTEDELKTIWRGYRREAAQNAVAIIPVGDFSPNELANVANLANLQNHADRLKVSLQYVTDSNMARSTQPEGDSEAAPVELVPPDVANALAHPTIWGIFASLGDELRDSILKGNSDELVRVGAQYIERFIEKFKRRRPSFPNLDIVGLLRRIAVHTEALDRPFTRMEDWVSPACESHEFDPLEAKALYDEADSFGLIRRDSDNRWRWTHTFVRRYFLTLP